RPSGLPAQFASILPPPKRVPRPAARTAMSGVSAMRMEPLVGADDLGQHRQRQHAGLAAARDQADGTADAPHLLDRRPAGRKATEASAPRFEPALRADEEGRGVERPFEDRLFPFVIVEQQHNRGPWVRRKARRAASDRERVLVVGLDTDAGGGAQRGERFQLRPLAEQDRKSTRLNSSHVKSSYA